MLSGEWTPQERLKRRGSYKKTAVKNRIREFIEQLDGFSLLQDHGQPLPIYKSVMEFYIQKFDLAQDRLAVKQYLKRLLIHGYFRVSNGCYLFVTKYPNQPTLREIVNVREEMGSIRAITNKQKVKRCW